LQHLADRGVAHCYRAFDMHAHRRRPARAAFKDIRQRHRRRLRKLALTGGITLAEAIFLRRRSGRFAGRVTVRCRDGHIFKTLWIPGASLRSVRLGPWRYQRCPVGKHWSLVLPIKEK